MHNLVERANLFVNQLSNTNKIDETKYQKALDKQTKFNQAVSQVILNKGGTTKEVLASIEIYVPVWEVGKVYKSGELVAYEGKTYVVIMDTVATEQVKPNKAKTSYQAYDKSAVYLDGFGKVIDVRN